MKIGGLGITYEEPDVTKYKHVRAHWTGAKSGEDREFASGDVVKDFQDACKWLQEIGCDSVAMSSDVDHFLSDDKDCVYYWDEYMGLIRRQSEMKQNIISNHKNEIECLKNQQKLIDKQIELLERQIKRMEGMSVIEVIKLEKQIKRDERKRMLDEIDKARNG